MPATAAPHAHRNGRLQPYAPVAPKGRSYISTDVAPVGAGHARDCRLKPVSPTAPAAQPRVTASLLANIALKHTLTITLARTRHAPPSTDKLSTFPQPRTQ
jgi:hypothetical protein